jgi:uncharacterized protein (DUF697 family)
MSTATSNGFGSTNSNGTTVPPPQERFEQVTIPDLPKLELLEPKAQDTILKYSLIAAGLGLIPIPLVDSVGLFADQFLMARELNALYFPKDKFFDTEPAKKTFFLVVGSIVPNSGFKYLAFSLLKAVPFIGTGVAMLTMPALAGTTTYALGQVFNKNFAEGNTFLSLDPVKYREFYQAMLKEGAGTVDNAIRSNRARQAQQAAQAQAQMDQAAVQAVQRVMAQPVSQAPVSAPPDPQMARMVEAIQRVMAQPVSPAAQSAPPDPQMARMVEAMQRVMAQPVSPAAQSAPPDPQMARIAEVMQRAMAQPVSPPAPSATDLQDQMSKMVDLLQQAQQAAQTQVQADQAAVQALRRAVAQPGSPPAQPVSPSDQPVPAAPPVRPAAQPMSAVVQPVSPAATNQLEQMAKMVDLLEQMRDMMSHQAAPSPAPQGRAKK